jgi:hypothetical protein
MSDLPRVLMMGASETAIERGRKAVIREWKPQGVLSRQEGKCHLCHNTVRNQQVVFYNPTSQSVIFVGPDCAESVLKRRVSDLPVLEDTLKDAAASADHLLPEALIHLAHQEHKVTDRDLSMYLNVLERGEPTPKQRSWVCDVNGNVLRALGRFHGARAGELRPTCRRAHCSQAGGHIVTKKAGRSEDFWKCSCGSSLGDSGREDAHGMGRLAGVIGGYEAAIGAGAGRRRRDADEGESSTADSDATGGSDDEEEEEEEDDEDSWLVSDDHVSYRDDDEDASSRSDADSATSSEAEATLVEEVKEVPRSSKMAPASASSQHSRHRRGIISDEEQAGKNSSSKPAVCLWPAAVSARAADAAKPDASGSRHVGSKIKRNDWQLVTSSASAAAGAGGSRRHVADTDDSDVDFVNPPSAKPTSCAAKRHLRHPTS